MDHSKSRKGVSLGKVAGKKKQPAAVRAAAAAKDTGTPNEQMQAIAALHDKFSEAVQKLVDLHEPDAKAKQVNAKPGGLKDMSVKQQREAMIRYLEHMPAELDPEIEQANEWARAVGYA